MYFPPMVAAATMTMLLPQCFFRGSVQNELLVELAVVGVIFKLPLYALLSLEISKRSGNVRSLSHLLSAVILSLIFVSFVSG